MLIKELIQLQSLAEKARQDFLNELLEGKDNYTELAKKTGLDLKQLYRIVNNQKGQPKLETIIFAYIQLLSYGGTTPNK